LGTNRNGGNTPFFLGMASGKTRWSSMEAGGVGQEVNHGAFRSLGPKGLPGKFFFPLPGADPGGGGNAASQGGGEPKALRFQFAG